MKICLIIDDYLPYSVKIGAKMMHELGVEFISQGHNVTVITPDPTLNTHFKITKLDGINVCYFYSGEIKNISKIKRAINETLMPYHAWILCKHYFKKNPHDLIVCYSPSIFWGGLVNKLKKLWNAPSYLIVRDLFPQWTIDQGLIKKGSFIAKYFHYFENINYNAANVIGVMSEKNKKWLSSNYKGSSTIEVLYNWADNKPVTSTVNYKEKMGITDKTVFFYGGNMGYAQDMMNIVRLAINMKSELNACFILVGAGDEVNLIKNTITSENLTNIFLLPPVSQNEFKQMLANFDIGLFSLHKKHSTHNFPGKLLGYMVQGLPILGSINNGNDLQEVIESAQAGLISVNGEDSLFHENALKLLNNRDNRKQLGLNAKKLLAYQFSVDSIAYQILAALNSYNK